MWKILLHAIHHKFRRRRRKRIFVDRFIDVRSQRSDSTLWVKDRHFSANIFTRWLNNDYSQRDEQKSSFVIMKREVWLTIQIYRVFKKYVVCLHDVWWQVYICSSKKLHEFCHVSSVAIIVYEMRQFNDKHIEIVCVFRRERENSVRI